ncbi:hypothetical protein Airi02_056940 [Actinoallomurus iriomotensis]|uniref:Uncharacterized protein n=1 Tax=Actinoallomurus iriomotensis TaxID=478107 RepID=A0A9W6S400_9ACTN|nr:hypothetical protein Airi02_056940 [Actinoallomurus iriomotensis]
MARAPKRKTTRTRTPFPEHLNGPALLALANTGDVYAWYERVDEQHAWIAANWPDVEPNDDPWFDYTNL